MPRASCAHHLNKGKWWVWSYLTWHTHSFTWSVISLQLGPMWAVPCPPCKLIAGQATRQPFCLLPSSHLQPVGDLMGDAHQRQLIDQPSRQDASQQFFLLLLVVFGVTSLIKLFCNCSRLFVQQKKIQWVSQPVHFLNRIRSCTKKIHALKKVLHSFNNWNDSITLIYLKIESQLA